MPGNRCHLFLLFCLPKWDMYTTPLAITDCAYTETQCFYGSYHCQILTPLKQATALCVSIDPTCAKPEWICGSHKMCSHPGPTLEIKVPYLSQLLMDGESSDLTSQATKMVAGHRWGLFAHKETVIKNTRWPSLSLAVTRFHTLFLFILPVSPRWEDSRAEADQTWGSQCHFPDVRQRCHCPQVFVVQVDIYTGLEENTECSQLS